jgi:thiamine-monophosphate kinase
MAAGEFQFIDWIRAQQPASRNVILPAGDDLAVMRWDAQDLLLVGIDQVLDGVHFDSSRHTPRQIGRKVMNRNLSDCAAMACLPAGAVASVALPHGTGLEYAKELYLGLKEAGDAFDCPVIGGDTGSWHGKLAMSVAILGKSTGIAPITRKGAKAGDDIYVTGPLGGSILGRHIDFVPRIREARELAATGRITAMIDISDGLSRDLRHICQQSRVGAITDAAAIPVHPDALRIADSRPPLDHALHDGEDHELLFTASPGSAIAYPRIGQITSQSGIFLRQDGKITPLDPRGWEHQL